MTDRDDDEGDQQISDTIQSALYREAACLNSVNENETKVRKEILTHPLVRFFVEKKFTKLLTLIWTSIILKVEISAKKFAHFILKTTAQLSFGFVGR